MRCYKITDECGWVYCIAVPDGISILLAPHTRAAQRITKEEYDDYILREEHFGADRLSARTADSRENHDRR